MPLHILDEKLWFPPLSEANEDGLVAIGGDLSTERILLAYRNGIFPWYDGAIPLWWSPDPRFVLYPEQLKVSKSMKTLSNKNTYRYTYNTCFKDVITACKRVDRKGQDGTWINDDIIESYCELHKQGFAHSAEAWHENELIGGLYGIWIGNIFFGESMFSLKSNASKFAFINLVHHLKAKGVVMIDCQVYTEHLESLGATMIKRDLFLNTLFNEIDQK